MGSGATEDVDIAKAILDQLVVATEMVVDDITSPFEAKRPASTIRTLLGVMVRAGLLSVSGPKLKEVYAIVPMPKADREALFEKAFDIALKADESSQYYTEYGFDELVKSVSRQMDHEGILVREYSEDRLWVGRFIDFLEKAKGWLAFAKADQERAKKKIRKLKQQHGNGN